MHDSPVDEGSGASGRHSGQAAQDDGARQISAFTYVAIWQGFVYVAFVIDTFARRIVGPLSADLAVPNRLPVKGTRQPHSSHGLRSRRFGTGCSSAAAWCRTDPSLRPRVAIPGDKIHRTLDRDNQWSLQGGGHPPPWPLASSGRRGIRYSGMGRRVHQTRRCNASTLEPIGNIPPVEAEANFYAALETEAMAA